MIENTKTYNGHTYCGVLLEACLNGYEQGRVDAIEKYRKEVHDMIYGNEEFTDWQKHEILECNELVAEQLKGAEQ